MKEIIIDNVKYHCFEESEVCNPYRIKEMSTAWNLNVKTWQYNEFKVVDLNWISKERPDYKVFASKEEMLKYIDENEPKFSKKEVIEAINTIYNSSYGDVLVDKIKKKLGI